MLEEDTAKEEIVARVAACDIGKAELVCCARLPNEDRPGRRLQEVTTWSTMTRSLLGMADHLRCAGVTRVVMEATSEYWKPVFYLLEAHGFETWLVNARDVKHLPGLAQDRQAGRGLAGQGRRAPDAAPQLRAPTRDPPTARHRAVPRTGRGHPGAGLQFAGSWVGPFRYTGHVLLEETPVRRS